MFEITKNTITEIFNGYIVIRIVINFHNFWIAKIFPSRFPGIFANIFQRKIIPVYSISYPNPLFLQLVSHHSKPLSFRPRWLPRVKYYQTEYGRIIFAMRHVVKYLWSILNTYIVYIYYICILYIYSIHILYMYTIYIYSIHIYWIQRYFRDPK